MTKINFGLENFRDCVKDIEIEIEPGWTMHDLFLKCVEVEGVTATVDAMDVAWLNVDGANSNKDSVLTGNEKEITIMNMFVGG